MLQRIPAGDAGIVYCLLVDVLVIRCVFQDSMSTQRQALEYPVNIPGILSHLLRAFFCLSADFLMIECVQPVEEVDDPIGVEVQSKRQHPHTNSKAKRPMNGVQMLFVLLICCFDFQSDQGQV